jgi:hypothetical protein
VGKQFGGLKAEIIPGAKNPDRWHRFAVTRADRLDEGMVKYVNAFAPAVLRDGQKVMCSPNSENMRYARRALLHY